MSQSSASVPERPASKGGRKAGPRTVVLGTVLALAAAGGWLAIGPGTAWRAARAVRAAVASRQFDEARAPLGLWLEASPDSAEAHYYHARLELAADRPSAALAAIGQAQALGYDRAPLECLRSIIQARAGRYTEAEPVLKEAFRDGREPRIEVAQELARVYLAAFQLGRAAEPLERWRVLAPEDGRPYLWRNEIDSRKNAEPSVLIRNYIEALKRDPNLDKARLGLAEQLRKDHRLDEARREYASYLGRHPKDVEALVGAALAALEAEDVDTAVRSFEDALAIDPRDTTALKELAQINLRRGRFRQACEQLRRVAEIDRFDPEIHYTYSRALKLSGDGPAAQAEMTLSLQLRKEHDQLEQIRAKFLLDSNNVDLRFQVARWYLDHGRDAEGLDWTKEILRHAPQHAPTHRLLARYHDQKGNAGLANYHRTMAETASGPDPQRKSHP